MFRVGEHAWRTGRDEHGALVALAPRGAAYNNNHWIRTTHQDRWACAKRDADMGELCVALEQWSQANHEGRDDLWQRFVAFCALPSVLRPVSQDELRSVLASVGRVLAAVLHERKLLRDAQLAQRARGGAAAAAVAAAAAGDDVPVIDLQ